MFSICRSVRPFKCNNCVWNTEPSHKMQLNKAILFWKAARNGSVSRCCGQSLFEKILFSLPPNTKATVDSCTVLTEIPEETVHFFIFYSYRKQNLWNKWWVLGLRVSSALWWRHSFLLSCKSFNRKIGR